MSRTVRVKCNFCKDGIQTVSHPHTEMGTGYEGKKVPCLECGGQGYWDVPEELVMTTEEKVRRLLEREIQEKDELTWCERVKEALDSVLEGIEMRISELKQEDEG